MRSELFKTPKIFFYDSGLQQTLWLKNLPQKIIGNVFETSIFFLLVRKYGQTNINYWRTKDKKEIDFIIRDKDRILPCEVKLNFAQKINLTAVKYFLEKYQIDKYHILGLFGEPKNRRHIYPWQI